MPDYSSRYDQVERIELGGDFWVDVQTCLTGAQLSAIESKRITYGVEKAKNDKGVEVTRRVIVKIDAEVYEHELAIASIVDWNITDGGVKWPLSPDAVKRAHYDLFDKADKDTIEAKCVELNAEPTVEEGATFPDAGAGSVHGGEDLAPDDGQIPA
jgi:hypothetical protein